MHHSHTIYHIKLFYAIIRATIFQFFGILVLSSLAQADSISITDVVTYDYNNINGSSDISLVGSHAGSKKYAYSSTINQNQSVTFTINATSVGGNPYMNIVMFNPNNHSQYWAHSSSVAISEGNNQLTWGPFDDGTDVHLEFTIYIDADDTLTTDSFVVYDTGDPIDTGTGNNSGGNLPSQFVDYYTPSNINFLGSNDFTFGQNLDTGESILWEQEIDVVIHNQELQNYKGNLVGKDDNDYLVLEMNRVGGSFHSSRVKSQSYDGIKINSGEKLSVEFEAQLPVARDSNGNYVPNVPLWPALWLMGRDQLNGNWIGWPFCAEIDAMEWSPVKPPVYPGQGYETQANTAYHWNTNDPSSGYDHAQTAQYYSESDIHLKFHKWRVDIYRYDDGINTNKIEIFMDDEYISGSRFYENDNYNSPNSDLNYYYDNSEFWYPSVTKNPQSYGNGEKEYFLIMNIAIGGWYPGVYSASDVPSEFDHAQMVVKNVTSSVTSLAPNYQLTLNYNPAEISTVTKSPDQDAYEDGTLVIVQATPQTGYLLYDNSYLGGKGLLMNSNRSVTISAYEDNNDDDSDGLSNYEEAIIHNSNLNESDTDNDSVSDYDEAIAGTSLTNASDYFQLLGSINSLGLYQLDFDSKVGRNYTIKVSDNLINWHSWEVVESNDNIPRTHSFDPNNAGNIGLSTNSNNFFFKVDIEKQD